MGCPGQPEPGPLDGDGTVDGIDSAEELGQHTIASRIGDATAMLDNQPIHDLAMRQ